MRSGCGEPCLFHFPSVVFPVLKGLRGYVAIQYDAEHGFFAVYFIWACGSLRGSMNHSRPQSLRIDVNPHSHVYAVPFVYKLIVAKIA